MSKPASLRLLCSVILMAEGQTGPVAARAESVVDSSHGEL